MREIKFRGRADSGPNKGKWYYGFYWTNGKGNHFIRVTKDENGFCIYDIEVDPKTVGQYTGLHDRKQTEQYPDGQEIYDGDILRLWKSVGSNGELRREYYKPLAVEYNPNWCQFVVEDKEFKTQRGIWLEFGAFEIIGNVHDNFTMLCS